MRAYSFRLQTVLRVRRIEAAHAQQRLAQAAFLLDSEQRREQAVAARYGRELGRSEAYSAATFAGDYEQGLRLGEMLVDAAARRTSRAEELNEARHSVMLAEQNLGVLEKLDDLHRQRWRSELLRQEALELDDFATTRATIAAMEAGRVR